MAAQVAIALDNARAYREIAELTDRLEKEKLYLEDEIRAELNFEEIVGESPALKHVLAQARTVAPSEASVLILGETGTGKELVARAIQRMSSRKDASFIKLNCAAIPTGLLESELFGHERGAFTGAISQKVGRLELADKGTLFLDEVGDIPLELQPKLLRVLQDQEFERLGSTRTIRVNIRLVAATNRDLAKSVAAGEFRSDLFYRLNVFPVRMPPLRERVNDVPLLVRYFVQKFARRMNKPIEAGEVLGLSAVISGTCYELTAETAGPCQVNFIEREALMRMVERNGELGLHAAQALSREFQSAYRDIHDLVLVRSSAGKLARLLLSWTTGREKENVASEIRIRSSLTHEEMAKMIGSSRETVTRLLSDLKKKELIRLEGSTLVIRNKTALEAIAA